MSEVPPVPDVPSVPAATPSRDLARRRELAIDVLCAHFARDRIELPDLEARLDLAERALDDADFETVFRGLPELPASDAVALGIFRPVRVERVPGIQSAVSIFGDTVRKGVWTLPERLSIVAGIGDVKLDLREARFGPEPSTIRVNQVLGDLRLLVPPGVRVEVTAVSLIGDVNQYASDGDEQADAPLVRVEGVRLLGDITITECAPGQSPKEARKRLSAGTD